MKKKEIVNPDDWNFQKEGFWKSKFKVTMSEHGPELYVNADNCQDALDYAIDYCKEKGWKGLLLDQKEVMELEEDGFLDDYISGGNEGLYLSSIYIRIEQL